LAGMLGKAGLLSTKRWIDRSHDLPRAGQAELLWLSRSTLHYEPRSLYLRSGLRSCGGSTSCS
jgi:hypothetical protein